jgi:hypothetical protein
MSKVITRLTAAQEILLGAAALANVGKAEFSEWDLTVMVWTRNRNKFGCRGYEDQYPDHKRVMMEIMGKTKKDNPLQRGWFEKTRTNYYRITSLGLADAERFTLLVSGVQATRKSAESVYDAVEKYYIHRSFKAYIENSNEPRTWLGAAAFWGLNQYEPHVLERQLRTARDSISSALKWMKSEGKDVLTRGPSGGGSGQIKQGLVEKLAEFADVLEQRFKLQIDGIRAKAS